MNGTVREWIAKAEGDFDVATREHGVTDSPSHDAVCFHCQQCIEKLMKGLLIQCGRTPPKVHDLVVLHELLDSACAGWAWDVDELRFLSRSAVHARYPGETADAPRASRAHRLAQRMRTLLLSLLRSEATEN